MAKKFVSLLFKSSLAENNNNNHCKLTSQHLQTYHTGAQNAEYRLATVSMTMLLFFHFG